jgi:hypothetical protein
MKRIKFLILILCFLAEYLTKSPKQPKKFQTELEINDLTHKSLVNQGKPLIIYYYVPKKMIKKRITEVDELKAIFAEKKKLPFHFLNCD